jgi:transposase
MHRYTAPRETDIEMKKPPVVELTMTGGLIMSGKKGQKHYPKSIKDEVETKYKMGISVRELSRKYGISRYAIQSCCELRPEVKIRQEAPRRKGRPRKEALITQKELEQENKRLQMENELLRDFLRAAGRK